MAKQENTVAVIENDLGIRRAAEAMLTSAAFDVESYSSADQFLRALPNSHAGCLLIDVHLRDISGIELLRHLRSTGRQIPAVLMNHMNEPHVRRQAADLGVALIEKPFSAEQLVDTVAQVMGIGPD